MQLHEIVCKTNCEKYRYLSFLGAYMEIKLCMGSACFARGNAGLLDYLEEYQNAQGADVHVELCGCRCEERWCPINR